MSVLGVSNAQLGEVYELPLVASGGAGGNTFALAPGAACGPESEHEHRRDYRHPHCCTRQLPGDRTSDGQREQYGVADNEHHRGSR